MLVGWLFFCWLDVYFGWLDGRLVFDWLVQLFFLLDGCFFIGWMVCGWFVVGLRSVGCFFFLLVGCD